MEEIRKSRHVAARRAAPAQKRQRGATSSPVTFRDVSREQERALILRFQAGDTAAGGILVRAHEALIRREIEPYRHKGVPEEDLMQCGRIGFCRGIERFSFEHGTKITTYAIYWVQHEAQTAVMNTGSAIRIPSNAHERAAKERKAGMLTEETIAQRRLMTTSSLDATVGDTLTPWVELQASEIADPEAMLSEADTKVWRRELIRRAMRRGLLTAMEREVIERRYLAEDGPHLKQIGDEHGRSRERIRQIEAKAMSKLRLVLGRFKGDDAETLRGVA